MTVNFQHSLLRALRDLRTCREQADAEVREARHAHDEERRAHLKTKRRLHSALLRLEHAEACCKNFEFAAAMARRFELASGASLKVEQDVRRIIEQARPEEEKELEEYMS